MVNPASSYDTPTDDQSTTNQTTTKQTPSAPLSAMDTAYLTTARKSLMHPIPSDPGFLSHLAAIARALIDHALQDPDRLAADKKAAEDAAADKKAAEDAAKAVEAAMEAKEDAGKQAATPADKPAAAAPKW